jgi:hypothetical protein
LKVWEKKIKAAAAEAASSSQFHYSLFYLFCFILIEKKNFDKKLLCTVLQQRILQIFFLNIL